MFSKKATRNYEIFTVDLHLLSKRQIDEDFVFFYGLLRKHELYRCILGGYSIDPDLICNVGTQFSEFPDKTSPWEMTKLKILLQGVS